MWVWSDSKDAQRYATLESRGYIPITEASEHQWRRNLELPFPYKPVREGYTVRPLDDSSELPSRSWASWRAFHPDELEADYESDWSWYLNIQSAPLYRRDLDLMAITQSGEVAAFTTIWYDDEANWVISSLLEPYQSTNAADWLARY